MLAPISFRTSLLLALGLAFSSITHAHAAEEPAKPTAVITLAREKNWLILRDARLPKGEIRINYLEAYCRPKSTDADWHDTVIGHTTELVSSSDDAKTLKLRCTLRDGVIVDHVVTAGADDVTFELTAHNPTPRASEAHWAQPCIRLGDFTGFADDGKGLDDYLPKCFVFVEGKAVRLELR
ncbi:MAG: hypothetical protein QM811_26175 [Pirellulales bacterium]